MAKLSREQKKFNKWMKELEEKPNTNKLYYVCGYIKYTHCIDYILFAFGLNKEKADEYYNMMYGTIMWQEPGAYGHIEIKNIKEDDSFLKEKKYIFHDNHNWH